MEDSPSNSPIVEGTWSTCPGCGLIQRTGRKSCPLCGTAVGSSATSPLPVDAPLLERARETSSLDGALDRFIRAKEGAVIAVAASSGMGRTRLLRHAVEKLLSVPEVRIYSASAREDGETFGPITRWLFDRFNVPATRSAGVARTDVTVEAQRVFARKSVASSDHVRRLLVLAGLAKEDAERSGTDTNELGVSLGRFFALDSEAAPIALILDRAEFASDEAMAVLREMASTLTRAPVLLLVAGTPDRISPLTARARVIIEPEPLSSSACEILCHHWLPGLAVVPEELLEAVVTRAAGAPGKVRELLLALIEANVIVVGDDAWSIDLDALGPNGPISSADLLGVRVSRLDEEARATLQRAAVVGEVFWEGAITAMARIEEGGTDPGTEDVLAAREHEALRRLASAELISSIEHSELANEREYVFAANGLREVLLKEQSDDLRRRRHDVCAGWLELAAGARADDLARAIAGHLERAGLTDAAARAYLRAARVARAGYRGKQAVQLYDKALQFFPPFDAPARLEALHDKGVVLALLGRMREAEDSFQQMLQLAYTYGARSKVAAALGRLGRLARARAEFVIAQQYLYRALELFQSCEDARGVAAVQDDLGMVAYYSGDFESALAHSSQALDMRRHLDDPLGEALSTHNLGLVHFAHGQPRQARAHLERALALREQHSDIEGQFSTRNVLAALAFERGEIDVAETMWREILELAETMGDRRMIAFASVNLGESAVFRGDIDTAKPYLDRAERVGQEISDRRVTVIVLRNRAALARLQGEPEQARLHLENSLAISRSQGLKENEALALRSLGELFAATMFDSTGDMARTADSYFQQSLELLEGLGATMELARARASYGMFLVERGDLLEARKQLTLAVPVLERLELHEAAPARRALSTAGGEVVVVDTGTNR